MSLFSDLANLDDALAATKKKLEHRALIGAYLKSLPPDEIAIAARLLIGRVFPESDPPTTCSVRRVIQAASRCASRGSSISARTNRSKRLKRSSDCAS